MPNCQSEMLARTVAGQARIKFDEIGRIGYVYSTYRLRRRSGLAFDSIGGVDGLLDIDVEYSLR